MVADRDDGRATRKILFPLLAGLLLCLPALVRTLHAHRASMPARGSGPWALTLRRPQGWEWGHTGAGARATRWRSMKARAQAQDRGGATATHKTTDAATRTSTAATGLAVREGGADSAGGLVSRTVDRTVYKTPAEYVTRGNCTEADVVVHTGKWHPTGQRLGNTIYFLGRALLNAERLGGALMLHPPGLRYYDQRLFCPDPVHDEGHGEELPNPKLGATRCYSICDCARGSSFASFRRVLQRKILPSLIITHPNGKLNPAHVVQDDTLVIHVRSGDVMTDFKGIKCVRVRAAPLAHHGPPSRALQVRAAASQVLHRGHRGPPEPASRCTGAHHHRGARSCRRQAWRQPRGRGPAQVAPLHPAVEPTLVPRRCGGHSGGQVPRPCFGLAA